MLCCTNELFQIPQNCACQIFQKDTDKVFGLHQMNETEGTFVNFQTKVAATTEDPTKADHQMWIRTYAELEGEKRFMIMNKKSELHLYADWHDYFTNGHITIDHGVADSKLFQNYCNY